MPRPREGCRRRSPSGDAGEIDEEGYLTIADRGKDVAVTGGTNVASREDEEGLFSPSAKTEAAVIALPHEKWTQAATAVVVLRGGQTVEVEKLLVHARESLATFKMPKQVFFREDLPRNTAGKILKRALRGDCSDAS